jgi:hypothetical protein
MRGPRVSRLRENRAILLCVVGMLVIAGIAASCSGGSSSTQMSGMATGTAPAVLQGFVTATSSSGGAFADISLSALQSISFTSGMTVTRQLNIPLQSIAATPTSPAVTSTGLVSISTNTSCPVGSPTNANCSAYTLVVPGSNPSVGVFSSSGFSYAAPALGSVFFTVDAIAALPMSGGAADCSPSEMTTSKDLNNQPLQVTPGNTTNVARIDFTGCS